LKEIKEAVIQELLPKAFTKRSTMYPWIDPVGGRRSALRLHARFRLLPEVRFGEQGGGELQAP